MNSFIWWYRWRPDPNGSFTDAVLL